MARHIGAALLLWCLAGIPLYAEAVHQPDLLMVASRAVILAIAAISLGFLLGGGLISLGHAAFLGIGAYTAAVCSLNGAGDLLIVLPLALAFGALFALVTGALVLRTRGINLVMATFVFGQMLQSLASSLVPLGGRYGLGLPQRGLIANAPILDDPARMYWVSFIALIVTFIVYELLSRSSFGRALRALGTNSAKMESLGLNRWAHQLKAYVISGAVCSGAGALLANLTRSVTPEVLAWQQSAYLAVMAAAGGTGSILGALCGAIALTGLQEYLPRHVAHWHIVLGVLIIALACFHAFRTERFSHHD